MTIAIAQPEIYAGDLRRNTQTIITMISAARDIGAEIIVFPELVVSGLMPSDNFCRDDFINDCEAANQQIAAAADGITVIYGNIRRIDGGLENACFMAVDGELGRLEVLSCNSAINGVYTPFNCSSDLKIYNLMLNGKVCRTGFLTGDWRNQQTPFNNNDIDLLINLSPLPFTIDSDDAPLMGQKRPYIQSGCCQLVAKGKTYHLVAGGAYMLDMQGKPIAVAPRFREKLLLCNLNDPTCDFLPPRLEQLSEAMIWAIRNFCISINVNHVTIGISGGIDSALAACLYTQALGNDNVLLISMPSKYSSDITRNLAEGMARSLQTNYLVMPMQQAFEYLVSQFMRTSVKRAGGGTDWTITLNQAAQENVQARERARILAAAAAGFGGIFTCNGNKAESTVGYATFYGDLSGAFAVAGDLWKHQVYAASKQMEKIYTDAPLAEIAAIRPSAELSAAQSVERGLGDPIIYEYHDYLFASWVEQKNTPSDILRWYSEGTLAEHIGCEPSSVTNNFATTADFCADIEFWWKAYRGIGVAKRQQAPPGLVLSRFPFGDDSGENQAAIYLGEEYLKLKNYLLNR